jgi:hypothetical protein
MTLDPQIWWFISRSSGLIAWLSMSVLTVLGILLASRMLRPIDRPAWLLALHRWVAALFLVGVGVHLVTLLLDSYIQFGPVEILVPMASTWRPVASTFGVIGLYFTVLVEGSSLVQRKMHRSVWRGIHYTSYLSYVLVSVHAFAAGGDTTRLLVLVPMIVVLSSVLTLVIIRVTTRGARAGTRVSSTQVPTET